MGKQWRVARAAPPWGSTRSLAVAAAAATNSGGGESGMAAVPNQENKREARGGGGGVTRPRMVGPAVWKRLPKLVNLQQLPTYPY
jgi:hypothetical protein